MKNFTWRPTENPDAHAVMMTCDDEYAGVAILRIPVDVGDVRRTTLVNRSGDEFEVYEVHLPARALGEFGVRIAHERVGQLLRRLLNGVSKPDVVS